MGASARSSAEPAYGLRLPARYRVRRHIAAGGMASVWCAEDLVLGRSVAVKVLAERFAYDPLAARRFKREARAAARVSAHPHAVTIFDVGDIEPGEDEIRGDHAAPTRAFIVMEYLAGGTVADALRVGAVSRPEALRWLREAASALDHAHQRGIVHRDIKPANFLLDNSRVLHVADFGIARLISEDTITSTGQLFGTAAYLAPEQALGHKATSACDRYALAVVAFELLTGERPFAGGHFAAQARQHIEDERPSASERHASLPPAVDQVLARGMAKAPEERYETAGAFVEALASELGERATGPVRAAPAAGDAIAVAPAVPVASGAAPVRSALPARQIRPAAPSRARPSGPRARVAGANGRPAVTSLLAGPPRSGARGGRMIALAALLVALAGVALVGILSQAGSAGTSGQASTSRRDHSHRTNASARHPRRPASSSSATVSQTSSSASAGPSTSTSNPSTATSGSGTPSGNAAALQLEGHQQLQSGSYASAIATLHQAVAAADPSSLTYAYALYDLGDALVRSGDPKDAIPILQQRLKFNNQTPVVQQLLNQALSAAGQAPASQNGSGGSGGGSTANQNPGQDQGRAQGHGHGRASTGGAGMPPGQGNGNGSGN